MKVALGKAFATITREPGDTKIRGGSWGTDEANFWRRVREVLKAQGLDVIRKEMAKDGHMVADRIFYVRTRKGDLMIWDDRYALRSIASELNERGEVTARIERAEATT